MTLILAFIVLALALVAVIYASYLLETRRWRECLRCGVFFTEDGERAEDLPGGTLVRPGVCDECQKAIEYLR